MRNTFILWVSALVLFTGCAVKRYEVSEPKLITLKTRQLKFNDTGFVRKDAESVEVALFTAGQPVDTITVDARVCVSAGCMSRKKFNAAYLSSVYPDTLLENVLRGLPVFGGKGVEPISGGFRQELKAMALYHIVYQVDHNGIVFKDKTNDILIKIRPLPR